MGDNSNRRLRFGDYELDSLSGELLRDGQPVKIQPQPLRVLVILAENRGEIVSRQKLRERIWGGATFVEFDGGLNYCIRQIRLALGDDASDPRYIETLPKQGHRLIASVAPEVEPAASPKPGAARRLWWRLTVALGVIVAIGTITAVIRPRLTRVRYEQLTDFADSAVSPAVSPDGKMIAFIRGSRTFLTPDQIYMKVLPNGEPKRLTQDVHLKYGPVFSPDGSQIVYAAINGATFDTFAVSSLGGDPHLLLKNAAGMSWVDPQHILFSRKLPGRSMGVASATPAGQDVRDLYFPSHERAMTHYSYSSPDYKSILVVEMNEVGRFVQCRLISADGRLPSREIGPQGVCTSAGVVSRWFLDVFLRCCEWTKPFVASAFFGWTAGTNYVRPNGRRRGSGRKQRLHYYFGRCPRKHHLDSRCERRTTTLVRGRGDRDPSLHIVW